MTGQDKKTRVRRVGLTTAEDLRKFLVSTINRLQAKELCREDARALTFIVGQILEILKFQKETEIEKRLAKLESLLGNELDEGNEK